MCLLGVRSTSILPERKFIKEVCNDFWEPDFGEGWIPHHKGTCHTRRYGRNDYVDGEVVAKEARVICILKNCKIRFLKNSSFVCNSHFRVDSEMMI
jgi:hypothetical protein